LNLFRTQMDYSVWPSKYDFLVVFMDISAWTWSFCTLLKLFIFCYFYLLFLSFWLYIYERLKLSPNHTLCHKYVKIHFKSYTFGWLSNNWIAIYPASWLFGFPRKRQVAIGNSIEWRISWYCSFVITALLRCYYSLRNFR